MAPPVSPDLASTDFAAILKQVAIACRQGSERPTPEIVVTALLQAEKSVKQQRLHYPLEALLGQWRLCFTTGTRKVQRGGILLGKGRYLPGFVPAYIGFSATPGEMLGTISNQIAVAGIQLRLTGPCRYTGKKNLLAFDFTDLELSLLGRSLYKGGIRGGKAKAEAFPQQAIAHLPFFAFFWVTDDLIAARGRGGGLAIWIKEC